MIKDGAYIFRECVGCGAVLTGRKTKWCGDECQKRERRRVHIKKCFNLSLEEYELILSEQDGRCAICKKRPETGKSLAVDHAHLEGQAGPVRGLLCFYCNKRILGARTETMILAMADYVQNPPAVRALGKTVIAPGRPPKRRKKRGKRRK